MRRFVSDRFDSAVCGSTKVNEALAWSLMGYQALLVFPGEVKPKHRSHECRAVNFAHLFDRNEERLIETAQALGYAKPKLRYRGTPNQHVVLCCAERANAIEGSWEHITELVVGKEFVDAVLLDGALRIANERAEEDDRKMIYGDPNATNNGPRGIMVDESNSRPWLDR